MTRLHVNGDVLQVSLVSDRIGVAMGGTHIALAQSSTGTLAETGAQDVIALTDQELINALAIIAAHSLDKPERIVGMMAAIRDTVAQIQLEKEAMRKAN